MNRTHAVLTVLMFAACAVPPSDTSKGTRSISGQLTMTSYKALNNPAVIAVTQSGRRFSAPLTQAGLFAVLVPTGEAVKLTVVNTVARGSLREISTLKWPGVWQQVNVGAPISLGNIRAHGSAASTSATDAGTSSHGRHDGDDHDGDGHDGDHGGDCKDGGGDHDGHGDGGYEHDDDDCAGVSCESAELCEEDDADESDCDHDDFDGVTPAPAAPASPTCAPGIPATPLPASPIPSGPCTVNADCAASQVCFQSVCVAKLN